jgi:hypothetical protein
MKKLRAAVEVDDRSMKPASGLVMPTRMLMLGGNPVHATVNVVLPGVIAAPPFNMKGTRAGPII